jgi:hypothetical protein
LRPGGHLLLATVNREWSGFNPSPFHTRYLSASELSRDLEASGFSVEIQAGFQEESSALSSAVGLIRRAAVLFHLIPPTMSGKALLKHIFYGRLEPVPARLASRLPSKRHAPPAPGSPRSLVALPAEAALTRYRVLYAAARKNFS